MELELKFALPTQDPTLLQKQLARVPLIGRRRPKRQALHNTYYDTPGHALQQQRVALRVRQIGDAQQPQWLQTLKIGGSADSAFSQRGEWELALPNSQLSGAMLADTPWMELDADGQLYPALRPVFTTTFERLSWTVALAGARVEIALDRGSVLMDGHSTPLCELEIELLSGAPDALFEAAQQISQQLCLLPLHLSKAERAYRLAAGTLDAPLRAKPARLSQDMDLGALAQGVLREAFLQFTANLYTVLHSDAPEVLHQARIGWRRFKSALQFFQQRGAHSTLPSLQPLQALLAQMTVLRDREVAQSEVLPAHARAYQAGDAQRLLQWQQLDAALAQDIGQQRARLRQLLTTPAVGQTLLQILRWLELGSIQAGHKPGKKKGAAPEKYVRKRMQSLAQDLKAAQLQSGDAQARHRVRILSKRLRYGVESLRALLPKKRAERWHRIATETQTRIGLERDCQQAIGIAEQLQAADSIVAFLRGAAFGAGLG